VENFKARPPHQWTILKLKIYTSFYIETKSLDVEFFLPVLYLQFHQQRITLFPGTI